MTKLGLKFTESLVSGDDYQLVGITNANELSFVDSLLNPNTEYYYVIRSVNDNGAAPVSNRG